MSCQHHVNAMSTSCQRHVKVMSMLSQCHVKIVDDMDLLSKEESDTKEMKTTVIGEVEKNDFSSDNESFQCSDDSVVIEALKMLKSYEQKEKAEQETPAKVKIVLTHAELGQYKESLDKFASKRFPSSMSYSVFSQSFAWAMVNSGLIPNEEEDVGKQKVPIYHQF